MKKLWNWLRRFTMARNRYEGGVRWSKARSSVPGFVQDARFDIDQPTRHELVRKSRYFERNNAIVNRLADLFEQFTVGAAGLVFTPASSDEDWNQRALKSWKSWCEFCDLTSLQTFGSLQSQAARSWFLDGEVFLLKTRGEPRTDGPARPRIQLIESHRIETPPERYQDEGRSIIDGIEINGFGRPVGYWIKDSAGISGSGESYKFRPADQVIHIFEPSRPGQYRGLPFLYPVLNDLHDLDDLQMLEMKAAKDAARVSNVLKTRTGEVTTDEEALRQFGTARNQDGDGNEVEEKRLRHYALALGGETIAIGTDESMEQFRSERPSVATREYWDYLTTKVCAGVGISKLLVFPESKQGTVARAELDIANAFFRARSAVLESAFKRVWLYWVEWAIRNERDVSDPPADGSWRLCRTRAPRAVNVDVGRNSAAMLSELDAGATTLEDIYAPLGQDWMERISQRAREEKFIDQVASAAGIAPERLRKSMVELLKAQAAIEQQRLKQDEEVEA